MFNRRSKAFNVTVDDDDERERGGWSNEDAEDAGFVMRGWRRDMEVRQNVFNFRMPIAA